MVRPLNKPQFWPISLGFWCQMRSSQGSWVQKVVLMQVKLFNWQKRPHIYPSVGTTLQITTCHEQMHLPFKANERLHSYWFITSRVKCTYERTPFCGLCPILCPDYTATVFNSQNTDRHALNALDQTLDHVCHVIIKMGPGDFNPPCVHTSH